MIKVLSLFSGIGAFEKALTNLNIDYKLVNYCEIDKYASKSYSLVHNVSEEKNLWDIRTVDTSKLPKDIDLITHGSPCQDFSLAGKNRGGNENSGTRSSLMYEALRIVKDIKPKYVIWENVKNLLSEKHVHNFNKYLQRMEELGYKNYYQVLNAKDYGIPQNRERIFTISIRKDIDKVFFFPKKQTLKLRLKDMLENNVDEKYFLSDNRINNILKWKTYQNPLENVVGNESIIPTLVANGYNRGNASTILYSNQFQENTNLKDKLLVKNNTNKGYIEAEEGDGIDISARMFFHRGTVQKNKCQTLTTNSGEERGVIVKNENLRIRKLTPKECWRLMGFSDNDFQKVSKEISNTQLYKQAGNSIVVNVLEAIFRNLFTEEKTGFYQTTIFDFI